MPSLGIAPRPGGCVGLPTRPSQDAAPVSGVFPTDGALHLLGIRIQAIQLSPYHAGPSTRRLVRLSTAADFLTCSCPLHLSAPGKSSDPGTFLRVPPNFIGDTTRRLAAHQVELPVDQRVPASTGVGQVDLPNAAKQIAVSRWLAAARRRICSGPGDAPSSLRLRWTSPIGPVSTPTAD